MPKPLEFRLGESEFSFTMNKVDRSKLYGFKELKVLNDSEDVCELATLAGDGRTLIGKGGTGLGWRDADGNWQEKSQLNPVDREGNEIVPVSSSFGKTIELFETATVDEYLEHNVRLIYALEGEGELDPVMEELNRGTIFKFPYSYRGGLEADMAFILANDDGEIMLAIGDPTKIEFLGMQATAATVADADEVADAGDLMDFDMI